METAYLPSTTFGADHTRLSDAGPSKPGTRPLTGSPKMRYGGGGTAAAAMAGVGASDTGLSIWAPENSRAINDLPLPRPRPVRDATGIRPASMYATGAVLEAPVQSAIERTVAKKPSRHQLFGGSPGQSPTVTGGGDRQLRSKWSQYFTSSASPQAGPAAGRARSESFNAPATTPPHSVATNGRGMLGVARPGYPQATGGGGGAAAAGAQPSNGESVVKIRANTATTYVSPASSHLRSTPHDARPFTSNSSGGGDSGAHARVRKLSSAFDGRRQLGRVQQPATREGAVSARTSSPLMSAAAQDMHRSRSATLPETRVCTTCAKQLRAEEQRQFASKPGIVYCADCYHSSYSRGHCAGCSKIVLTHGRPWVQHGDRVWHKLCIKCRSCNKLLITPLIDLAGLPTCEPCFVRTHPGERPRFMPKDEPPAHPLSSASHLRRPRHVSSASDAASSPLSIYADYPGHTPSSRTSHRSHTNGAMLAASIPTPALTEDGRSPSRDVGGTPDSAVALMSNKLGALSINTGLAPDVDLVRIMSPVEVAEKEGLPPPRPIVDPDLGAISRSESQVSDVRPRHEAPVAAARPPLSPSLKNPNSPTARTASPRSVSFRIDEPPISESRISEDNVDDNVDVTEQRSVTLAPAPAPVTRTLADYVRSKATTPAKSHTRMPSVAETIKKFSTSTTAARDPNTTSTAAAAATLDKSQLPGLDDLLRTHQREPPTEPTIPTIDKHSKVLKSRPRNQKRRRPSQTPAAIQEGVADASSIRSNGSCQQPLADNGVSEDMDQFTPNQCARCTDAIDDTWFRLSDGRQVHVECFTCQGCQALIDDGVYVVEDNIEYHPQCVPPAPPIVSVSPVPSSHSSVAMKPRGPRAPRREEACDRCRAPLSGPRFQLTNGKQYHPECFACAGCSQRFDEGSYVCFEGQEFHHQCVEKYAAASSSNAGNNNDGHNAAAAANPGSDSEHLVCGQCSRLIEGVFLRHNDAVFHPDCFCCIDCQRAITPGMPFGEIDSRPCCEACLEQRVAATATASQQQQQQQQNGWSNSRPYYPATKTGGY
ncbi:hypothetical protein IW138_003383 [Coemansia sp. RSA 986]|nr:hypothetical protein LPJ74_004734 [Coemansia sp. RSA 1843]KAJ2089494.1 hypothetical protein IW138_003383 [Coemansia sp. RSA 986]